MCAILSPPVVLSQGKAHANCAVPPPTIPFSPHAPPLYAPHAPPLFAPLYAPHPLSLFPQRQHTKAGTFDVSLILEMDQQCMSL